MLSSKSTPSLTRKNLRESSTIGSDNLSAEECLSRLQWNSSDLPRKRLFTAFSLLSFSHSSSSLSNKGTCKGFFRFSTCKYGEHCKYSHSFEILSESCEEVIEHNRLQQGLVDTERSNAVVIIRVCSYEKWIEMIKCGLVDPTLLIFIEISQKKDDEIFLGSSESLPIQDLTLPLKQREFVLWSRYGGGLELWESAIEKAGLQTTKVFHQSKETIITSSIRVEQDSLADKAHMNKAHMLI
jgi:hypothetical protein